MKIVKAKILEPQGLRAASLAVPSEARINAGNTHVAGEYFVAAELAKRGYTAALSPRNAKAVDVYAERNGDVIGIQVKAIAHKRNVGWPLPFEKRKIIAKVIYVCVILNGINEQPTYFILEPEDVLRLGKWYATRAVLNICDVRKGNFLGAWHLIDSRLQVS